jgi:transposase
MPRRYGYALKGERCFGKHNWQAKGRTNVIGALYNQRLLTTCLYDTYIDSAIFQAWMVNDLLPKVPKRSVLILDNAAFHKVDDIQMAIQQADISIEYLPPYSPDLNPIEHKWAHAKTLRRTHQCSIDDLFSLYSL